MSESTLIHVCRHGEVFNPNKVLYARLPGHHLSERGFAMAERLGEYFADVPLAALRVSPLERTRETMAPIAARHESIPVVIDDRLIEADSLQQGWSYRPSLALLNPRKLWIYRNPIRPSWGEAYVDMAARTMAAIIDTAVTVGPGAQAVLVSHQSPIFTARMFAEGKPLPNMQFQRQCTLASVTTFEVVDRKVVAVRYSEPAGDLLRKH
jgi:broad specificity phosphatase PhoE